MIRPVKMFRGVFILGRITTADVAATHAEPQVHPGVANFQAIFTTIGTGLNFLNLIEMCTSHDDLRIRPR